MKLSARNVLPGKVSKITKGAVNSEVLLLLDKSTPIIATITNVSVEKLGLKEGSDAQAIIKASSVIVGSDLHDVKLSARNVLCGTVAKIVDGPVSAEIDIEIGGGNMLTAVITEGSAKNLGLKEGGHACAVVKASSVIVAVG
jgi:molybdate transport system regulatory protein